MKPIEETFLERDWEGEEEARNARNARADELRAQGLICVLEDLYNAIDGRRVFMVIASEAERLEVLKSSEARRSQSRSDNAKGRSPNPKRKTRSGPEPEIR
ncbi:MAG TPA: hypothetical protein V6C88_00130 [Chroococcidiopsis sp.]